MYLLPNFNSVTNKSQPQECYGLKALGSGKIQTFCTARSAVVLVSTCRHSEVLSRVIARCVGGIEWLVRVIKS